VNIIVAGLWRFMSAGIARWGICFGLVAAAYWLLGKSLAGGKQLARRVYRYAD